MGVGDTGDGLGDGDGLGEGGGLSDGLSDGLGEGTTVAVGEGMGVALAAIPPKPKPGKISRKTWAHMTTITAARSTATMFSTWYFFIYKTLDADGGSL